MWPELFVCRNGRILIPLLFIFMIIGGLTACQTGGDFDPLGALATIQPQLAQPTPDSAATAWAAATRAAQPTPTPVYAPGEARTIPLPAGELIAMQNWDVQVLDIRRGEEAWQMLQAANQYNEPPQLGREYLLIQFWVKNKSGQEGSLWIETTGNRHRLYKHYRADVVRPEPRLETRLAPNEESLGWLAYEIAAGEGNLLVRLKDGIDFRATAVYAALEEGNSLRRAPALDAITPTDWGQSPDDPLILGQIATADSWQIQVKDLLLGTAAYDKIMATNRFNDPPEPGMQYGLVYLWVRYIGPGETPASVAHRTVEAIDAKGNAYRRPSLVVPRPELLGELYPGGEVEGWLAIQIPQTDSAPLLRVELSRGESRYLSLATGGR